jgi:hypothetical protein
MRRADDDSEDACLLMVTVFADDECYALAVPEFRWTAIKGQR